MATPSPALVAAIEALARLSDRDFALALSHAIEPGQVLPAIRAHENEGISDLLYVLADHPAHMALLNLTDPDNFWAEAAE